MNLQLEENSLIIIYLKKTHTNYFININDRFYRDEKAYFNKFCACFMWFIKKFLVLLSKFPFFKSTLSSNWFFNIYKRCEGEREEETDIPNENVNMRMAFDGKKEKHFTQTIDFSNKIFLLFSNVSKKAAKPKCQ